MVLPSTPNSNRYPLQLQLKLYQAFIFSIPILFSIILFLLFYLFYLKRRASTPHSVPPSSNQPAIYTSTIGLKKEVTDKLPTIFFDEELRRRESQCCVCLGDFEMKEELLQIPSCKHVFHIECIHHWLCSNSTCPLCRIFVVPTATTSPRVDHVQQTDGLSPPSDQDYRVHQHPLIVSSQQQEFGATSRGEFIVTLDPETTSDGSPNQISCPTSLPVSMESVTGQQESVIIRIGAHGS